MPVFKVDNNPQKVPVRPPWMRQDSIPQVNNSAPWRRQQSVNKSDPPSEPPAVPSPQGQRKQSKIEIIPSLPSNKSVPSILAVPPPIPAPPTNPNLNMTKKDSTPIQVSSRKVTKPKAEPPKAEQPKPQPKVETKPAANGVQKKNALNEEKSFKDTVLDIKTAESKPVESEKPAVQKSVPQNEAKPAAQKPAPVKRQQTIQVS